MPEQQPIERLESRRLLSGAPNGPYALTAAVGPGASVNLTFHDSADNETGFVIERADSAAGPFAQIGKTDAVPGSHGSASFVDSTVTFGANYVYRVYAVNGPTYRSSITPGLSVSVPLDNSSTTTNPGGAPNGPYALVAKAISPTQVQILFRDSADNETGFIVERSDNGAAFTKVGSLPAHTDTSIESFADNTAQGGHTYSYRVYAVNGPYVSSIAGPVQIITPTTSSNAPANANPGGAPNAPFGMHVSDYTPSGVTVSFYDSANNETGFVIERAANNSAGPYTVVANLPPSSGRGAKLTFVDTTAQSGVEYFYRAYAVNGFYRSSYDGPCMLATGEYIGGPQTIQINPIDIGQPVLGTPPTLSPPVIIPVGPVLTPTPPITIPINPITPPSNPGTGDPGSGSTIITSGTNIVILNPPPLGGILGSSSSSSSSGSTLITGTPNGPLIPSGGNTGSLNINTGGPVSSGSGGLIILNN